MNDSSVSQQGAQIDIPVLEQLARDTDDSMIPELLAIFLSDGRLQLEKIESALASCDDDGLAAAAHALGGSMATFGLTEVSRIVQQCESAIRGGDISLGKAQAKTIIAVAPPAFEAISDYAETLKERLSRG